jgi:hypothetical protein
MPNVASAIIAFARHIAKPGKDPRDNALERVWIDATGVLTRDGMALHDALVDQDGTRSALRNMV